MKNIEEFKKTLNNYRDGQAKLAQLKEAHERVESFSHFTNFLNDSEKRANDPSYSVMQEKALSQFIKLLKNNDYETAQNITFLERA